MENNTRDIDELERFAGYFGMTIDQVVHFDNQPVEVTIQNKPNFEQINLINQLDEEDCTVVFKIIDTMLTKRSSRIFLTTTLLLYSDLLHKPKRSSRIFLTTTLLLYSSLTINIMAEQFISAERSAVSVRSG